MEMPITCSARSIVLEGVVATKEKLQTRGLILSLSVVLSRDFVNSKEFSQAFIMRNINEKRPMLIVGWRLSAFVRVWLAFSPPSNYSLFSSPLGTLESTICALRLNLT